jgi:hypothetical protein
MDGQHNPRDGSSGQPGPLLQFHSYRDFAVHNILQYYFGTGEDDKKPGLITGDTINSIF